jgi:hypothetical protein
MACRCVYWPINGEAGLVPDDTTAERHYGARRGAACFSASRRRSSFILRRLKSIFETMDELTFAECLESHIIGNPANFGPF